jgi:hypothetical protein
MSGSQACSDVITLGRSASDFDGPGERPLFFRLLLSIATMEHGPQSHALGSWRVYGSWTVDAITERGARGRLRLCRNFGDNLMYRGRSHRAVPAVRWAKARIRAFTPVGVYHRAGRRPDPLAGYAPRPREVSPHIEPLRVGTSREERAFADPTGDPGSRGAALMRFKKKRASGSRCFRAGARAAVKSGPRRRCGRSSGRGRP